MPTFVLSGLSKVAALPQMKAAWMACFAEREALQRLEVISDTFLSMSAPIQHALPAWLGQRQALQGQIRERVEHNLANAGRHPAAAEPGNPAASRGGLVCRAAGSRGADGRGNRARTAAGARGGGASWRFLWFFRAGVAGGKPAGARRGVHEGVEQMVSISPRPLAIYNDIRNLESKCAKGRTQACY